MDCSNTCCWTMSQNTVAFLLVTSWLYNIILRSTSCIVLPCLPPALLPLRRLLWRSLMLTPPISFTMVAMANAIFRIWPGWYCGSARMVSFNIVAKRWLSTSSWCTSASEEEEMVDVPLLPKQFSFTNDDNFSQKIMRVWGCIIVTVVDDASDSASSCRQFSR